MQRIEQRGSSCRRRRAPPRCRARLQHSAAAAAAALLHCLPLGQVLRCQQGCHAPLDRRNLCRIERRKMGGQRGCEAPGRRPGIERRRPRPALHAAARSRTHGGRRILEGSCIEEPGGQLEWREVFWRVKRWVRAGAVPRARENHLVACRTGESGTAVRGRQRRRAQPCSCLLPASCLPNPPSAALAHPLQTSSPARRGASALD